MSPDTVTSLPLFATFGDLLKYLRRRAGLTQRELSIAVGYSEAHISRLEQNQRLPDLATLAALFVPALHLEEDAPMLARLLELAATARGEALPASGSLTITRSVARQVTETIETLDDLPPNNLPLQLTSFVGRETQINEIKQLFGARMEARLLTLTGTGGTGKTRLALQVAADLLASFPNGVWFVELAPLADPALVIQTVAGVWGVRADQNQTLLNTLVDYARSKSMLLVLDNCEHLIEACAQLAQTLLSHCSKLKVLATSREMLNVAGETLYQVPTLSLPAAQRPSAFDAFTHYEAIQLFVERAGAAMPGFSLTRDNVSAIAQICQRLDGIPLALELAAAWVKLLRVEEIAARLDDRFHLLTQGSRVALPRHQTLRALIDWSWERLPEPERVLLRRLSVFAGDFTLEAVEAVTEDATLDAAPSNLPPAVSSLSLLSNLANKSLLLVDRQLADTSRYRLLETIRHYAREKLIESAEEENIRDQHLAFFLALAEKAEPELRSHHQIEWLERLEREHDNLRVALNWSLERKNCEAALRLAGALYRFWQIRGYASEGRQHLTSILGLDSDASTHPALRAKALLACGELTQFQGDYVIAQGMLQDALERYRQLDDQRGIGYALHALAAIYFWPADYERARPLYEQSLAILRAADDAWGVGNCLYGLGLVAHRQGDIEMCCALLEESVEVLRQVGDKWSLTYPLGYLAWMVWLRGDASKARALYDESLEVYRVLGDRFGIAKTLSSLSVMCAVHGDHIAALTQEEESLAIARELGSKWHTAWSLARLGEVFYWQTDLQQARALFDESMILFREMDDREGAGMLLRTIARVCYHEGDLTQAAQMLQESLAMLQQVNIQAYLIYTLFDLGQVARLQGAVEQAASLYRQSLEMQRERGIVLEIADRFEGLAKLAVLQSQPQRAARLFGAGHVLRERLGTPVHPVDRADYDRNLAVVRAALGEEEFASAWVSGQRMTPAQAIEYALMT